ncbi:MAG: AAA family ATPase [Myxococcaceae bacterium]
MTKTILLMGLVASFLVSAKSPTVVCITGGTAAGKTTFVKNLQSAIGEGGSVVLGLDGYYLSQSHLTIEEKYKFNWDHPRVLNWDLVREHLSDLKSSNSAQIPIFDFVTSSPTGETVLADSADVIIFEGIHALYDDVIREQLCDHKVFIDIPAEERLRRRIERDQRERGRSEETTVSGYYASVKPMHEEFIEPIKDLPGVQVVLNHELDDFLSEFVGKLRKAQNLDL